MANQDVRYEMLKAVTYAIVLLDRLDQEQQGHAAYIALDRARYVIRQIPDSAKSISLPQLVQKKRTR